MLEANTYEAVLAVILIEEDVAFSTLSTLTKNDSSFCLVKSITFSLLRLEAEIIN